MAVAPLLRWRTCESHLIFGLRARYHASCCRRSDQYSQGAAGLPDAARHLLSPEVDATGGGSVDPERLRLYGGDGAFRQTPPADDQRASGHKVRQQDTTGFHLSLAAGAGGCA